jgi:hypothetical protein
VGVVQGTSRINEQTTFILWPAESTFHLSMMDTIDLLHCALQQGQLESVRWSADGRSVVFLPAVFDNMERPRLGRGGRYTKIASVWHNLRSHGFVRVHGSAAAPLLVVRNPQFFRCECGVVRQDRRFLRPHMTCTEMSRAELNHTPCQRCGSS